MPAGLTNPALGYAGFCAVKLAGYSLAGWYLSWSHRRPDIGALRVGATRTLIGMAAGRAVLRPLDGEWISLCDR